MMETGCVRVRILIIVTWAEGDPLQYNGGRHTRQNEMEKEKVVSYESAEILDTCVPRLLDIKFRTV